MKQIAELLAPAGSVETMYAAFAAGADAVYIGGSRFGARAYADNAESESLLDAIDYAHLHGKKLYLTVNTLLKEQEMDELYEYLLPFYRQGLDAVIVQDFGVFRRVREWFPDLAIHASTQMTVSNLAGVKFLESLNFRRVVLSRELSLEEIEYISSHCHVEIEIFVHGALCVCYSGQCLMSSFIGGRSGNRGACAQPCRMPYNLTNASGEPFPSQNGKYLISLKDMSGLEDIERLAHSRVASLKIEGRMKSPEYVYDVVSSYRTALDMVEEGKVPWKEVIRNFYPDLKHDVDEAEKELEKVDIQDEVTDVICDNCGRNMVIKYGPHGRFLACPGFPDCRNTKPYYEKIGVACPKCGGEIVMKKTKKGRKYYGCENNPECDFMSWQKPSAKKCPKCGNYMLEKGNKLVCSQETCGYVEQKPKDED